MHDYQFTISFVDHNRQTQTKYAHLSNVTPQTANDFGFKVVNTGWSYEDFSTVGYATTYVIPASSITSVSFRQIDKD